MSPHNIASSVWKGPLELARAKLSHGYDLCVMTMMFWIPSLSRIEMGILEAAKRKREGGGSCPDGCETSVADCLIVR